MKTVDFSESIAACDLKFGRQLVDLMNRWKYLRSRSFLDLGLRSFTYENNPKSNDYETWRAASGIQGLQSLYKL